MLQVRPASFPDLEPGPVFVAPSISYNQHIEPPTGGTCNREPGPALIKVAFDRVMPRARIEREDRELSECPGGPAGAATAAQRMLFISPWPLAAASFLRLALAARGAVLLVAVSALRLDSDSMIAAQLE
jgi:hypothetical protein